MASNRNRRNARVTKDGSNVVGIQRKINRDYSELFHDYKKLSAEIWNIPFTKYLVGGIAIAALTPVVMNMFGGSERVTTLVRDNFEGIRNKVDDVLHRGDEAEA